MASVPEGTESRFFQQSIVQQQANNTDRSQGLLSQMHLAVTIGLEEAKLRSDIISQYGLTTW